MHRAESTKDEYDDVSDDGTAGKEGSDERAAAGARRRSQFCQSGIKVLEVACVRMGLSNASIG